MIISLENRLTIAEINSILFEGATLKLSDKAKDNINKSYEFLKSFSSDKVIYGINTGFGPMAQYRVEDKFLKELQYNIIRSHSTGAGEPLDDIFVKAAMIARVGTLVQG